MRIQREVAEYILTKKAGLARSDIHGEDRRGIHVERRHDLVAVSRRVCSRVGRGGLAACIWAPFVFVATTAALAGLEYAGKFVALAGNALAVAAYHYAPDSLFDPPAPKAIVTESSTDGMTNAEVDRRLSIHTEREQLREEKIERRRKRQERKSKSSGGGRP